MGGRQAGRPDRVGSIAQCPEQYDLSGEHDEFWRAGSGDQPLDHYAPIQVWPAAEVGKADTAAVLAGQRIVTAPMGVLSLAPEDLASLAPVLGRAGYETYLACLTRYPGWSPIVPIWPLTWVYVGRCRSELDRPSGRSPADW